MKKADVYSFAMLLFEIMTQKAPFEEDIGRDEWYQRVVINNERPIIPIQNVDICPLIKVFTTQSTFAFVSIDEQNIYRCVGQKNLKKDQILIT
jgi:hypothetical protein